ncbi:substrate-binding domain-containing protein [Mesorhizobium sp. M1423]|uniref:substrate-binding domain-containing protein n=1 Tax=Mesorhizobium sp. M1423 TaxID=2957101 RepID=UPI0033388122
MLQLRTLILSSFLAGVTISTAAIAQQTVGPKGETATPFSALVLTDEDVATLKEGKYKAAVLWHVQSDLMSAVDRGVHDELARLGIEVVVTTDANLDVAKQRNDVETAMAKSPDLILTVPIDPVASAAAFAPARDKGVKLVFAAGVPDGYVQGKDYVALLTDDLFQMGEKAADELAKAIGGKGEIGYIYYDAKLYVPNQRDQAFKYTIEHKYPDIKIVASQGIVDALRAEEVADGFLLKHPNLDGIYVTWAQPAESVLASLRNAGNTHTKLVTIDLSEGVALDMIKGGNVAAIIGDDGYNYGVAAARAGGLGLLGKSAPPYIVVPALAVTKNNVKEGWNASLHRDPPQAVLDAIQ